MAQEIQAVALFEMAVKANNLARAVYLDSSERATRGEIKDLIIELSNSRTRHADSLSHMCDIRYSGDIPSEATRSLKEADRRGRDLLEYLNWKRDVAESFSNMLLLEFAQRVEKDLLGFYSSIGETVEGKLRGQMNRIVEDQKGIYTEVETLTYKTVSGYHL